MNARRSAKRTSMRTLVLELRSAPWSLSSASLSTTKGLRPASGAQNIDPRRVGGLEWAAWVAYYRRDWQSFLRAVVLLIRHTFGLSWWRTLRGAWWVLRANQAWAPYPDNRPDAARRFMARFYRLVARAHGEHIDPHLASRLEVEWWRVHRDLQHGASDTGDAALVAALVALYGYVYDVGPASIRAAAEERAAAMRLSDQWVAEGCHSASPLLAEERAALVRSYAALLAAVHRSSASVDATMIDAPSAQRQLR